MENEVNTNSNLELEEQKTTLPQSEVEEQTVGQEAVEIENAEQPASAKWCVYIGYALIALGLLDFCLGNFSGIDLVFTFKYTPVIFGAVGALLIKNHDTFGYREILGIVGLLVILVMGTAFFKSAMQKAETQTFVGQWEDQIEGVTRIFDLKEDNTFVLKIIADDGSAQIQGEYKIAEGEGNKKCIVMTYDINTLTEPELKDFFEEYNEKVKKAEKKREIYGIVGVRVEGDSLLVYDNGSMKKSSTNNDQNLK